MTAEKLRQWRGVKPVALPSGAAIRTRFRTTAEDERVLDLVAGHLGALRRADLAAVCGPQPLPVDLDANSLRQARRDRLNSRKAALTAQSSSRWANAIIAANDAQYRFARDAQHRHIVGLRTVIATIEKRLAQPSGNTMSAEDRKTRRTTRMPKGYPTQAERFEKQRRLQHLRVELTRAEAARAENRVRVVEGGNRLAKTRHHLDTAGLTQSQWRERWDAARYRIAANGSTDEPFGNLTITVTPAGEISVRLPKPLEHLANAQRGRYVLSGKAVFSHRADEWAARITGAKSLSYAITREPGRAGRYLTASWAAPTQVIGAGADVIAASAVVGVDLNADHLAVRCLDAQGNPVGAPERIDLDITGTSARRDAQVRHGITRLIHYTQRHGIDAIAVEDLDFADARTTGREAAGRGRRGKRFRKTVAGIPTAVFRKRLSAQAASAGIRLFAVNPAYTSAWGDQHWRKPYKNVTRHQAAATVIGRRAQGFTARRRKGVTCTRLDDRAVRATNQPDPTAQRRAPAAATGHGRGEPNPANPTGQERGYRAGQPLPRQWPTVNHISNGRFWSCGR